MSSPSNVGLLSTPIGLGSLKETFAFCRRKRLTPFQIFQAGWALTLHVYTSSERPVFGCIDAPDSQLKRRWINIQTGQRLLHIAQHFQSSNNSDNCGRGEVGNVFDTIIVNGCSEQYNMQSNIVIEVDFTLESISAVFRYQPSILSPRLALNVALVLSEAISKIIYSPYSTVEQVSLSTSRDISILSRWNVLPLQTHENTIPDLIYRQSNDHPNTLAVHSWDGSITYSDLDIMSTLLARYLTRIGIKAGSFVPLLFNKSKWTTLAMLAIMKAGGAFVLFDPSVPFQRLREMYHRVSAEIILCSEDLVGQARGLSDIIIPITDGQPEWAKESQEESIHDTHFKNRASPEDAAYAVFTSGSTGKPKCAVIPHRSYASAAMAHTGPLGLNPESRVLQFASYAFDATVSDTISTLIAGGCVCVPLASETQDNLASAIRRFNVNWIFLTPTVARLLIPVEVPSLKTVILGGEAVTESDIRQWMIDDIRLVIGYGPSECTPCTSVHSLVQGPQDAQLIGRPTGAACWITHPEDPNVLMPIGAQGELLVEGPIVGWGYLGDEERTKASFINPPQWRLALQYPCSSKLYRTGDLAQYTGEGRIRYIGRKDAQVKLNGQRLELGEVQHCVKEAFENDTLDVIVEVVIPADPNVRPILVAFVVQKDAESRSLSSNAEIFALPSVPFHQNVERALAKIRTRLPRYMVPSIFVQLAVVPVSPSGKIDRKLLRQRASALTRRQMQSFSSSGMEHLVPATEREQRLCLLISDVLDVEPGMEDNFFQLGGDSISAMSLVAKGRESGLCIRVADVFSYPRLVDLAKHIRECPQTRRLNVVAPFALVPEDISQDVALEEAQKQCRMDCQEIEDVYPCTPVQEGMMALTATNPDMYVSQAIFDLPANLNFYKFKEAWNRTVENNPILRTRIIQIEGSALQVVCRTGISWDDHGGNHQMGFGMPLIQVELDEGRCRFMLSIHHALYDGWSLPLIFRQVESAYRGEVLDYVPFSPFVSYLVDKERSKMEMFWKEQMKGVTVVPFPATSSSPQRSVNTQAVVSRVIEFNSINSRSTTLATAIRLAWALTISRYTGSLDVVMGVTSAGRNVLLDAIHEITGPTITTMPFRISLDLTETAADALHRVQEATTALIPFEHLGLQHLKTLGPSCAASTRFRNLLVIHPGGKQFPSILGTLVQGGFAPRLHGYDFVLECDLGKGTVNARARFNSDAVNIGHATRILNQFSSILKQLQTEPKAPIFSIARISSEDLSQAKQWNRVPPKAVNACVHDIILTHTTARPNAPAVSAWDGDLTYHELDSLASKLAVHLSTWRVGPESFVPLYFEKSKWTIVAMLAVLKAGGAFVLLDISHPQKRIETICQKVQAKLMLTSTERQSAVSYMTELDVIPIGHSTPFWNDTVSFSPSSKSIGAPNPSNPAYVVFTSGSTGAPKGTVIEHRSFSTNSLYGLGSKILNHTSRVLQFASYTFDASIAEILFTLTSGGCVCVPRDAERINCLVDCIQSFSITHLYMTPSVARILDPTKIPCLETLILCGEPMRQGDLSLWAEHVRLVNAYGPSECSIASVQQLYLTPESQASNIGTSCSASTWIVDPDDHEILLPIGAVGELLIEGPIVGRYYLGEPAKTTAAFINSPHWLTRVRGNASSRVYKTGDLVRYSLEMDGSLEYVGRKDHQIKIRGQRLELGEIEHHIFQSSDVVQDAIVELMENTNSHSSALVAFILASDDKQKQRVEGSLFGEKSIGFQVLVQKIRKFLEDQLPAYMIPSCYIPLLSMPITSTGKIARSNLRGLASSLSSEQIFRFCEDSDRDYRGPSNEYERSLQQVVAKTLHLKAEDISLDADFFQLGGDSLTAMHLVSSLRRLGFKDLRVTDLYKMPILFQLAEGMGVGLNEKPSNGFG